MSASTSAKTTGMKLMTQKRTDRMKTQWTGHDERARDYRQRAAKETG